MCMKGLIDSRPKTPLNGRQAAILAYFIGQDRHAPRPEATLRRPIARTAGPCGNPAIFRHLIRQTFRFWRISLAGAAV